VSLVFHSRQDFNDRERARLRLAVAFLQGRLTEPQITNWALGLNPDRRVERAAIVELLTASDAPPLPEPYASAWLLIIESWSCHPVQQFTAATALLHIRTRLRTGDRSNTLIEEIIRLVAPRLELKPPHRRPWLDARKRWRPITIHDLFAAGLTGPSLVFDFRGHSIDIALQHISEVPFLHALASALTSAIDQGLYAARRIYGDDANAWPADASPLRVYFVRPQIGVHDWDAPGGRVFEPDGVTRGIGPAVKLLYSVVQRVAELAPEAKNRLLEAWRYSDLSIYRRLWAATARNPQSVPRSEVSRFLLELDDNDFWNLWTYPEFAELRAVRFATLQPNEQKMIARRLRKGPSRRLLPKNLKPQDVRLAKRALAVTELRRIEIGGGVLPSRIRKWLFEAADEIPGLEAMTIDSGFRDPWVRPDFRDLRPSRSPFDDLAGVARLQALEDALSANTSSAVAANWLEQPGQDFTILCDFEAASDQVSQFPTVWNRFGHIHSRSAAKTDSEQPRIQRSEANRVLALIIQLTDPALEAAIEGLCYWLQTWSDLVDTSKPIQQVWLRMWSHAVKFTNSLPTAENTILSGATLTEPGQRQIPDRINTVYPPAAKLVHVFLHLLRSSGDDPGTFSNAPLLACMRDRAINAPGYSGLIARSLFTENLPMFLRVDRAWAKRNLIEPLFADNDESILLWHAVSSSAISSGLLNFVGDAVCKKVLDDRLHESTRENLVDCLVYEALTAFQEQREPSVSFARISQTLRSASDSIRAWAALGTTEFQNYAYKVGRNSQALGASFQSAIEPFLEQVWPMEQSLATGSVSRHLACLPAVCGDSFTSSVDAIERFLAPFGCRCLLDYGFCESEMSETLKMPRLSEVVDDTPKARSLLRLLDLTIGHTPDAIVPDDLDIALERIRSIAPELTSLSSFRRLAAAART